MLDMLLFWVVYGLWTVVSWSAVVGIGLYVVDDVVNYVTHGDKELPLDIPVYLDWHLTIAFILSCSYQISYWCTTLIGYIKKDPVTTTMHEVAINISEFVVTHLSTPIYITLIVGGLLILARKVYPFIKRVSQTVSKLEEK